MREASGSPSIFCISSYEKGQAFLREAARLGAHVTLLTVEKLRDADWPKDILHEFLTMPEEPSVAQMVHMVSFLARTRPIDRIVALDEFDLEYAAVLREHMRLPGLGLSATRLFRDKLAMRSEAKRGGIAVPEFAGIFNYADLANFMREVPGPWLLKPRTNASAVGIKPISEPEQLWPILAQLGDLQSDYLLERFVAGKVYHVEGVTWAAEILAAVPCEYGHPPIETMHQGGVFTTRVMAPDGPDTAGLLETHSRLLPALHLQSGVTHSEFIKSSADGKFYFLETAARVGGAYIAEMTEFATGLNPWVEWARIEIALARGQEYKLAPLEGMFAGSVISLAKQEEPDTSAYTDPEIVMRLHKTHHAGILLRSASEPRLRELVETYAQRFLEDFNAVLAAPDKPTA